MGLITGIGESTRRQQAARRYAMLALTGPRPRPWPALAGEVLQEVRQLKAEVLGKSAAKGQGLREQIVRSRDCPLSL